MTGISRMKKFTFFLFVFIRAIRGFTQSYIFDPSSNQTVFRSFQNIVGNLIQFLSEGQGINRNYPFNG